MSTKALLRGAATWLGVALVTLLVCEVALRIYNPVDLPLRGTDIVLPTNKHVVFENPVEDSKLDARIEVDYNRIGFRGPDPPADWEEHYTIFAVGGSTTHSARQGNGLDWPSIARTVLDERFENTWLNNAGLEGHSTFGHIYLLDQFLVDLKPDMMLFLVGINDRGRVEERSWDRRNRADESLVQTVVARSELLSTALVLWRLGRAQEQGLRHWEFVVEEVPRRDPASEDREAVLAEHRDEYIGPYRERVLSLIRTCREADVEPVLITQPSFYGRGVDPSTGIEIGSLDVGDESATLAGEVLELYNDVLRELGAEQGLLVIDLAREMPKDSALFYDWMHYTNSGAEVVGQIVARHLVAHLAGKPGVVLRSPGRS